ncbi:MAG: class I SAM-dependent methyltransferase [Deltaproteobacteria bacterium]|nr:class I SAM-dependent methyltransferase [Deltaproteobacteria bacterium]
MKTKRRFLNGLKLAFGIMCSSLMAGCAASSDFNKILAHPARPENERALDSVRKPEEVLKFYGVKAGDKVADIMAARGYYTVILSQVVGEKGQVYSVNSKPRKDLEERLKDPAFRNVRAVDSLTLPENAGLDFAFIHLNYHDLPANTRASLNKNVFAALKPGGVYGIVDHSAAEGSGDRFANSLHRIDKQLVIKEVTQAGFVLVKEGEMLRRPDDTRDFSTTKVRGKDDRFVLYFEKRK